MELSKRAIRRLSLKYESNTHPPKIQVGGGFDFDEWVNTTFTKPLDGFYKQLCEERKNGLEFSGHGSLDDKALVKL